MSLFNPNGRDVRLPLLTQFYQLEISPRHDEESDEMYGQRLRDEKSEALVWADRVIHDFLHRTRYESPRIKPAELSELADLHRALHRLMDSVADVAPPDLGEMKRVEDLYERLLRPRFPNWRTMPEDQAGESVHFVFESPRFNDPRALVTAKLLQSFVDALRATAARRRSVGSLIRCEVCQSVFIAQKAEQKRCSHRCTDRIARRRARSEKREESLTSVLT